VEALASDYAVRVAMGGESALRSVAKALPGLILLDVMMPGMDGFEGLSPVERGPGHAGHTSHFPYRRFRRRG